MSVLMSMMNEIQITTFLISSILTEDTSPGLQLGQRIPASFCGRMNHSTRSNETNRDTCISNAKELPGITDPISVSLECSG